MDVRAVLIDIAAIGPFFVVDTAPAVDTAPLHAGRRALPDLHADPEVLGARIVHVRDMLGADDRVAASIAFQGLAARLLSPPLAAAAVHGVLPDLDGVRFRTDGDGAWPALSCAEARGVTVADPAAAATAIAGVLDSHLAPLVTAVRAQVPISARLLWGNVASSVAAGKRLVGQQRPAAAPRAVAIAERLLAAGPLVGSGTLRPPEGTDVGWTFRRRSCCLFYRVPGGGTCGDCVLLDRRSTSE